MRRFLRLCGAITLRLLVLAATIYMVWFPIAIGLLLVAVSIMTGSVSPGLTGAVVIVVALLYRLFMDAADKARDDHKTLPK